MEYKFVPFKVTTRISKKWLTKDTKKLMDELEYSGSYEENSTIYQNFSEHISSHYISEVTFGGTIQFFLMINYPFILYNNETEVSFQIKTLILNYMAGKDLKVTETHENSKFFLQQMKHNITR